LGRGFLGEKPLVLRGGFIFARDPKFLGGFFPKSLFFGPLFLKGTSLKAPLFWGKGGLSLYIIWAPQPPPPLIGVLKGGKNWGFF